MVLVHHTSYLHKWIARKNHGCCSFQFVFFTIKHHAVLFFSSSLIMLDIFFRILLDRAHTDVDLTQSLDSDPEPEPLASPLVSSLLCNTSTSENNTSDSTSPANFSSSSSPRSSSTPVDLSQILLNIKSCRWRHFRPRTLSHHPLGEGDLSRRGIRDFSRTMLGLTRILSAGVNSQNRTGPATTPINGEYFVPFTNLLCVFTLCCLSDDTATGFV